MQTLAKARGFPFSSMTSTSRPKRSTVTASFCGLSSTRISSLLIAPPSVSTHVASRPPGYGAIRHPLGEPLDEVERGLGDLAPAVIDGERVPAIRDLHDLRHSRVSLL